MKKRIKDILVKLGYRSKPSFIIIGAQKAGTSALYNILVQHSLISGSLEKEIHYFDNDVWYSQGNLASYHSYYPLPYKVPKKAKLFEATPIYLFHPEVASRLHAYNSNLKLIVLLRNPAIRAFSAWSMYHHNFRTGKSKIRHDPRSFTDAINEEMSTLNQTSFYDNKRSYIRRGIYHYQLETFLEYFPENQILFIESGTLKEKHKESLSKIQSFIDVPYEDLPSILANEGKVSEIQSYKMDILKLKEFYVPYNRKLFDLIGTEFDWDVKL